MNGEEFTKLLAEERGFLIDDPVIVRWTNCGRPFQGNGKITKINEKTIRVCLEEHVASEHHGGYPAGYVIIAPRVMNLERWSANNCVIPRPSTAVEKAEAKE